MRTDKPARTRKPQPIQPYGQIQNGPLSTNFHLLLAQPPKPRSSSPVFTGHSFGRHMEPFRPDYQIGPAGPIWLPPLLDSPASSPSERITHHAVRLHNRGELPLFFEQVTSQTDARFVLCRRGNSWPRQDNDVGREAIEYK
ncbi:unnamed protein product [Protopolystoma xenopodis]|uniref:Uncharacterized protein n=1 Tax=Protopolystoma xenopodis TaxID=117903 RepID=A0A3S5A2Z3_9PLAT|nr:unnamed protein product [Protopolystoma xenopodis]